MSRGAVLLESLVAKLGVAFTVPEEVVVKQFDEAKSIYFLVTGDCTVNLIEHTMTQREVIRLLTEGDHFGEIGVVFNCKRTASVISRNYNTMARLSKEHYRELISDF
eukprot:CAMPEP_0170510876 /NCGR_PEP_ID=MMETSP0208-20121228/66001_1 /TAXON_ID=197538 /ORGANISM="Strombidium inclinatum, Strain S3" /LENGTH=106 /DNA_ID=CAMNT_0010794369 /DNA_START=223 /DNA_END=543 /DNA_ORIENTATION=-